MKFNFVKKITSVLAGAIMLSSTFGFAVAANYPEPFVKSGAAQGAIVYGVNAAISDLVGSVDVQRNLGALVTSTTTTTSASAAGESINIGTAGSRKIYYKDPPNVGKSSLSSSELPNILGGGKVTDLSGTEYTYTQSIVLGTNKGNVTFGTSGGDISDPALHLDVGTSGTSPLYNYTLELNKNLNVSDATNVQGQKIKILGVEYVIGASSTNSTLYLYGSGETVILAGGETKTVTIAGTEHTVELITTSSTTEARISVDGVAKTVTENNKYQFAGDVVVYLKDVTHPAFAGDIRNAELIIGQKALKLANAATVKTGADETSIKGTNVIVRPSGNGQISGFTIGVAMPKSKTDHLADGESFTDPVFGGLSVQFAGAVPKLDDESRDVIKINTDDNAYAYVTFTSARAGTSGEQRLTYTYDNDTASTTIQPILAYQALTSTGKGKIHVVEGENVSEDDYVVVNQGDAGTILEVEDITTETPTVNQAQVTFRDVITGESQKITLSNTSGGPYSKTGVNIFGGNGYTIMVNGESATVINITWNDANEYAIFPRIKLKEGGWIALMQHTVVDVGNNTVDVHPGKLTANGTTTLILPDGRTTLTTAGTNVSGTIDITRNVTSNIVNGINWSFGLYQVNKTINISGIFAGNGLGGLPDCVFNASKGPAILFLEPKKWDDSDFGNSVCVPMVTTGTTEIAIGDPVLNGSNSGFVTKTTDTYQREAIDIYGNYVIKEDRTNQNGVVTIKYPKSQMYFDVLFTVEGAAVTPGTTSGGGGQILIIKDSEIASVSDKNLVVIGGSCINSVAAKILGSDSPLCTSAFTDKTGVGAGQYIIKTIKSPYNEEKVAMLVAGYEAADTTNAVNKLLSGEEIASDVDTENIYPQITA